MVGALALLATGALAQQPDLLVSLSGDDAVAGLSIRDEELICHAPDGEAFVQWPTETLALVAGDPGGTGLNLVLGDVDAVHDTDAPIAADGIYLSLLSNEEAFLDGDVLRGSATGFTVWRAEAEFVTAVGAADANVDVDAFQLDPDGTVLFSFAENEPSLFLAGDVAGEIADGDVLLWPAGAANASILLTEGQVASLVSNALGGPTTIGEVMSLARHPGDGEILFTVQSPSSDDATVFSTAGGGSIVPGHAEPDFGFEGSPEIDALAAVATHFAGTTVSDGTPQPGDTLDIHLRGALPGELYLVLAALTEVPPVFALQGWGGFVLDSDVLLNACLDSAPNLALVADAFGKVDLSVVLPLTLLPGDIVVQVVRPGAGAEGCNPLALEIGQ